MSGLQEQGTDTFLAALTQKTLPLREDLEQYPWLEEFCRLLEAYRKQLEERTVSPPEREEGEPSPGWKEREQRRRREESGPPIQPEEIDQAEEELVPLHKPVVQRMQALLDSLAGRRGESVGESKKIATRVNDLARRRGVDLTCEGQTVNIRWHGRVFEARLTDGTGKTIDSSAGFPRLEAQPKSPAQEIGSDLRVNRGQKSGRSM